MSHASLSFRTLLAYALPALPLAILALPFYVIVPEFYAREVGIPISSVGAVLLIVRIIDAISDPLAGWLCDRYTPDFGRRRMWTALSAPLVALAAFLIFIPPAGVGPVYLLLTGIFLSVSWTALQVPYLAWGAELADTPHGRTRVAGWREGLTVTGTLIALVLPAILQQAGYQGQALTMTVYAGIVGIGVPLTVFILNKQVPEPVHLQNGGQSALAGWRSLLDNHAFVRLTAAFFINGFANGLPATLFVLYVTERLESPAMTGPLLVLYFLSGVAGMPVWLYVSKRLGKQRTWCLGMALAGASFTIAVFLAAGDVMMFGLVCVLTGLALGADYVLPASMQADVIDADAQKQGSSRAGLFLGFWTFASKLAFAGAVGLAFPLLGYMGLDPARNLRMESGLLTLALLYAGLPVLLKSIAIAIMWREQRPIA